MNHINEQMKDYTTKLTSKSDIQPSSSVISSQNYYEQISKLSESEKIAHLKLYEREAKRIIPNFPSFPLLQRDNKEKQNEDKESEQEIIYKFMTKLFPKSEFHNIKPKWLNNTPLNCYSEELMIAVEYHDDSFYMWPNSKHKNQKEFESSLHLEREKQRLCSEYNICLIIISHLVTKNELPYAIYCKLLDSIPYLNVNIRAV